jgi:hypothetical protein
LNRAFKTSQAFLRTFPTPAPAELQEHVALGVGVKPQVTGGGGSLSDAELPIWVFFIFGWINLD